MNPAIGRPRPRSEAAITPARECPPTSPLMSGAMGKAASSAALIVMLTRAGHHSSSRSNHGFQPESPIQGIARSAFVTIAGINRHGC